MCSKNIHDPTYSIALTLRLRSSEPERILPLCTSIERTLETWPWSSLDSTSDPFGRRLKKRGGDKGTRDGSADNLNLRERGVLVALALPFLCRLEREGIGGYRLSKFLLLGLHEMRPLFFVLTYMKGNGTMNGADVERVPIDPTMVQYHSHF